MTFAEARDWLFSRPECIGKIATINQRESQHKGKDTYVSCEMSIFHMTQPDDHINVYGPESWAEAKAAMEAKLTSTAVDQSPQEDVAA